MKTDELVAMLSRGETAIEPTAPAGRYTWGLGWGAFGATLLMAMLLGVRPDLSVALRSPMFWLKLSFVAALATASLLCVLRLSRPGAPLGTAPLWLLAPFLAMGLAAALSLMQAEPASRPQLLFGQTWNSCPFNIAMLSLPTFAGGLWAMKGLAPTRPALAGAAVGLLAGTVGALVYALHCPEMAAPFLVTWYVIGMLVPAAAGAFIGARLLRW